MAESVQEAVDEYFKTEALDENVQWEDCYVCGERTQPTKTHYIMRFPEVLFVQLLRWTGNAGVDILYNSLTLNDVIILQNAQYRLRSVVIHSGETANSGHYFAHARHEGEAEGWWVYNDQTRNRVSESGRATSDTQKSYLCLYERQEENFDGENVSSSSGSARSPEQEQNSDGVRASSSSRSALSPEQLLESSQGMQDQKENDETPLGERRATGNKTTELKISSTGAASPEQQHERSHSRENQEGEHAEEPKTE